MMKTYLLWCLSDSMDLDCFLLFRSRNMQIIYLICGDRGEMCVFMCVFHFVFCIRAHIVDDCMRLAHFECAHLLVCSGDAHLLFFFTKKKTTTARTHNTTYSIVYLCQKFMVVSRSVCVLHYEHTGPQTAHHGFVFLNVVHTSRA